jgi:hypothetical protein
MSHLVVFKTHAVNFLEGAPSITNGGMFYVSVCLMKGGTFWVQGSPVAFSFFYKFELFKL